jgi:phosphohistidine phosphatase
MDLYLIRHASAIDGSGRPDEERALTREGRQEALDVGAALARHAVQPALIVSSPLVRAIETAELVAVSVSYAGALEVARALAPNGTFARLLADVLEPRAHEPSLALVGHEPSIGEFLSTLLDRDGLNMRKGEVVRLRWTPGRTAELVWALTPHRLEPTPSLDWV